MIHFFSNIKDLYLVVKFECFVCPLIYSPSPLAFLFFLILNHTFQVSRLFIKKVIRMEKNIGEYLSRKSTEVIAIVACIGLIITIILAAGSIRTEREKAHMVLHSSCLQTK